LIGSLILLKDPSNAQYKNRPRKPYAIIFTHLWRSGPIKAPFANSWVAIIALGDLDKNNGLPISAPVEKLTSGEYVILDGDDTHYFSGKGGGMALLLVIEK
jgi:hypothetical protein